MGRRTITPRRFRMLVHAPSGWLGGMFIRVVIALAVIFSVGFIRRTRGTALPRFIQDIVDAAALITVRFLDLTIRHPHGLPPPRRRTARSAPHTAHRPGRAATRRTGAAR